MDYYVNPMWFYAISVFGGLRTFLFLLSIACLIAAIACAATGSTKPREDDEKTFYKAAKRYLVLTIVFVFIGFLIPTKETMYQMLIAATATKTNVKDAVQIILNAAKEIIQEVNK